MTATITPEMVAAVRSLIDDTEVSAAGFRQWVARGNFTHLRDALSVLECHERTVARAELAEAKAEVERLRNDTPTDDEFVAAIKPIWLQVRPCRAAQEIRSSLSVEFDNPKFKQWMSNFAPDWVWSLVDIAAQRGMDQATTELTALRERIERALRVVEHARALEQEQRLRHWTEEGGGCTACKLQDDIAAFDAADKAEGTDAP